MENRKSLFRIISDFFYDISVYLHSKRKHAKKAKSIKSIKRNELIFCLACLILPITQMLIFYFGVNINSILLSFKRYDAVNRTFVFNGLNNFKNVLNFLFTDNSMKMAFKNSMVMYLVNLLIATPLNLIFAYFMYKKIPFSGFFRIVLFLPAVISSVVLAFVYKYAVEYFIPFIGQQVFHKTIPILTQIPSSAFTVVIVYGLWTGFGGALILYTGAMNKIPPEVIEYGKLEGIGAFREFTQVVIPMIFPTITTFLVVGFSGIFTAYGALYIFYGASARTDMWTLGYYWFTRIVNSQGVIDSYSSYPEAAAAGLIFTIICAPITLLIKHVLEKYGPQAEV